MRGGDFIWRFVVVAVLVLGVVLVVVVGLVGAPVVLVGVVEVLGCVSGSGCS